MAHMDAPRRVGKHLEYVVFRAGLILRGGEALALGPDLLPFGFGLLEIVASHGLFVVGLY